MGVKRGPGRHFATGRFGAEVVVVGGEVAGIHTLQMSLQRLEGERGPRDLPRVPRRPARLHLGRHLRAPHCCRLGDAEPCGA